jgi:ABC-type Na+ efflux pump permease subunit
VKKILHVAQREFLSTVATRAFLIAVLFMPAMIAALVILLPRLMSDRTPQIDGEIAVVDPTGQVTDGVRDYLAPDAIKKRNEEAVRAAMAKSPMPVAAAGPGAGRAMEEALRVAAQVPNFDIVELPDDADIEREKEPLKGDPKTTRRLALVVVQPNAVARAGETGEFGSYDLYVRGKLDDRVEDDIRDGLRSAIVDARVRAAGMDRATLEALTRVPRRGSITVTAQGEGKTNEAINVFLPLAFMILLIVSVFSAGQYLLTSTIEEKSNRVVEVLLSAVSPLELMTGKILGQMGAGFLMLALYAGLGIATLVSFAMFGLVDRLLFVFLLVFFVLTYLTFGGLYAAVGSAVNDIREAQTLLMPLMVLLMIPYLLWMPITRDPNSTFSIAVSFLPPINFIAMLLRMTSSTPPPMWQVLLTIAIGIAAAIGTVWFASKVFRIGVLQFGKAPNFATLVRWARMA